MRRMERVLGKKHRKDPLTILEMLIFVDMWLLIRSQWLMKRLFQLIAPALKIILFMTLGAVFIVAYAFAQARLDVNHRQSQFRVGHSTGKYLEIDDDSRSDTIVLRKELVKMKSETTSLEKTLYRMNAHLNSLYSRHRNMETNLADFASETVGGLVIDTPGTETYSTSASNQMSILGIPIWKTNHYTPRKVIQPWTEPGECWAFRGSHGKVKIELAYPAIIERVTLEHISASASLTGKINEAPKIFNVLGELDNGFVMIDTFMYKNKGPPSQTFEIKKSSYKIPFKTILLEILSNWGNPDYTCIYRFKVHGKIYVLNNEANTSDQ